MNALISHTTKQNWFFKYRLYHIPFWYLYNYLWWSISMSNFIDTAQHIFLTFFFIKISFYALFQAGAVYFTLYYLVPKYLQKGKFIAFLAGVIITLVLACALIVPGYFVTAWAFGKPMQELYGNENFNFFHMMIGTPLSSTTACITFGLSIKLAKNWVQTQRRQQLLEKEKLETELNFLKYQFNPHFLFNSINSIFFLIHKNPDMASASLAKFSDLLRYQLYECNDTQIPLRNEITYLENFIELEKLRLNNNVQVSLSLETGPVGHFNIAPFILMTFVENAFKHVSKHTDQANWIEIRMQLDDDKLQLYVANSTSDMHAASVMEYGGIGLKNAQRRLDLLYPGEHVLEIRQNEDCFIVQFSLQLHAQTTPTPEMALTF